MSQSTASSGTPGNGAKTPPSPRLSTEPSPFILCGGTVTGTEHLKDEYQGNGNQDSFGWREIRDGRGNLLGIVAVIADGCGSRPDSATGARAAVRISLNAGEDLIRQDVIPEPPTMVTRLQNELLSRIAKTAAPLARTDDISSIIDASYLFTILILIITPKWTIIAGLADGIIGVNGAVEVLEPRKNNHPEYISYLLLRPIPAAFEGVEFNLYKVIDTTKIQSLALGTDGAKLALNGRSRRFNLTSVWTDPRYRQENVIGFELAQANRVLPRLSSKEEADGSVTVRLVEDEPLFTDDATVVVIIRNAAVPLPEAWLKARGEWVLVPPAPPHVPVPALAARTQGQTAPATPASPPASDAGRRVATSAGQPSTVANPAPPAFVPWTETDRTIAWLTLGVWWLLKMVWWQIMKPIARAIKSRMGSPIAISPGPAQTTQPPMAATQKTGEERGSTKSGDPTAHD
jgi:hypothetical protein